MIALNSKRSPLQTGGLIALLILPLAAGCYHNKYDLVTADELKNGLVLILPGVEGPSRFNANIARGLREGGVKSAIQVYDWGTGSALGWMVHLTALERNRHQARRIARRILAYQSAFPNRPVHLIGHSGGGGIAVLALEYLPPESKVTGALLLAGAVSPDHDLRRALSRTELGIWNYYSKKDIGFLTLGTSIFGSIDRRHGRAAGAVGFKQPPYLSKNDRALYQTKLHQVAYSKRMRKSGHIGSHTGWTSRGFVRSWLAPMLQRQIAQLPKKRIHLTKARAEPVPVPQVSATP
jgi:pimeloyl-ACP methyl ester carboxylesterase